MSHTSKFCPNCGSPIQPDDRFCGSCGQPISATSSPEPIGVPPESIQFPSQTSTEKQGKSGIRWIVIVVCIVLIGLGAAYSWYGKSLFLKLGGKVPDTKEKLVKEKPIEKVVKKQEPIPTKGFYPSFDRSSLDRYVSTVRFFESGHGSLPVNERAYKTDFSKFEARYINWEINLKYPAPGRRIDFNVDAVWRRSDGSIYNQETIKAYIEPNWNNSWHGSGWGNQNPGTWPVGSYVVELYVEGKKIAKGSFKIY